MYTWTRRLVVGAALLAGCTGKLSGQGVSTSTTGNGTGSGGSGSATGAGGTGTATSGSGGSSGTTSDAGVAVAVVDPTVCVAGTPVTSQLPRLLNSEYDNTVHDLLGVDISTTPPSSMLAPDSIGSVDQRTWDGYQTAADSLAAQVIASTTLMKNVVPCTPSGDGSACATQFIQTFGPLAFRRPLTAAELSRFTGVYTNRAMLTSTGSFNETVQFILKEFLLSPSFLTKGEISEATPTGNNFNLSPYEVATRLSYMMWGSMPDATLFSAAAANQLSSSSQILAQAQRMLADPKARAKVADFHATYALMGPSTRWSEAAHDPSLFPAFTPVMVPLLTTEAQQFFDYVTFNLNGSFQDLITKPIAFVNKDLAPIYGLSASDFGADLQLTNLDATQRAGVFTHAGFLGSYSHYDATAIILRGAFLEKQVLCRQIPAPPPGATNTPLPTTPGSTMRDRVAAQTSGGTCAGCHSAIVNPAGFALEAYDGIGAWQTTEAASGVSVDSTADVLIGNNTVHVSGPVDLMSAIAASPEAQSCYAQRWVAYAYQRDLTGQDVCTVQGIASKMSGGSGYSIQNLVADLTQSSFFLTRATTETP